MNRLLTISAAAVLALPLFGAIEKPATAKPADAVAKTAAKPARTAAAPAATQSSDSPLVAAAKRAALKRQNAKSQVITNDTLKSSTGAAHITTTNAQHEVTLPKSVAPGEESAEVAYNVARADKRKREAAEAEAKKKAEAERQERLARAAARADEEGFLDDPAAPEPHLEHSSANQPAPAPQK